MKMNLKEAYFFVFDILENNWRTLDKHRDKAQYDELAIFLSEMFAVEGVPITDELHTSDPAAWDDWVKAVRRVVGETKKEINKQEAKTSVIELMEEYKSQGFTLDEVIYYIRQQLEKQVS